MAETDTANTFTQNQVIAESGVDLAQLRVESGASYLELRAADSSSRQAIVARTDLKLVPNGVGGGTLMFIATSTGLGFFGGAAAAKPTVSGSRGANAALASLLTGLASLGLLTDSSTA
jgi:hypothetical protein